jgi:predicted enzyme related to lactoylglutathione lyase
MAADLQAVIDFYEGHFGFTLSGQQNSDLLAFLLSL